jgi:hypothetical protein
MAMEADVLGFTRELAHILILPTQLARQIVEDQGGEALACAARAIGMPGHAFERIVLFLDPELGASVQRVYTLSRFYDRLSERVALIMLAAWRGTTAATARSKYQPALHDDDRQRARGTPVMGRSGQHPVAGPLAGVPARSTVKS